MSKDESEKNQKEESNNALLKLIKNYPVIALIGALIVILGIAFAARVVFTKEEKADVRAVREERKTFQTNYFDESMKKREGLEEPEVHRHSREEISKQRKYDSKIEAFVQLENEEKENETREVKPESRNEEKLGLSPGTLIPARVEGTIFSFNTRAPVTCSVTKDIQKDGKVLIPKDSRFLGEADVLKSVNRINVAFHLLVLPDGRELKVRAMAVSADSSSGIKGRVDKHHDRRVFKAVGETLLAGASLFTASFPSPEPYSLRDELQMNLAEGLTREAARDLRSERIDTSITVENFTPIQVLLLDGI